MRNRNRICTVLISAACAMAAIAPVVPAAYAQPTAVMGLPDFSDLVKQVGPAVVNISVVKTETIDMSGNPFMDDPFYDFLRRFGIPDMPGGNGGGNRDQISRGVGSGFIISQDGYVLTNAHVVGDKADKTEVTVRLIDKREFSAKVVGTDKRTDIALLKIDAKDLPVVKMGNPEEAQVGQWVIAVGSPFGFENTVTAGIISAKARRLPSETYVPFIQTDVAINPGNSGGPLFNLAGEVIGINSQIYSRSGGFMGISFAIPIDVALHIKNQLIEHGRVQRGKLGVMIQNVDKDLAQSFGLKDARGALVASVEPDSAAARAGIKSGDIITGVDGQNVEESVDLPRVIGEKPPGTVVHLDVWSNGKSKTVNITLDEMSSESVEAQQSGAVGEGKLGISGRSLTKEEADKIGVPGGVLVESVSGVAQKYGLNPGDVLLALNNQQITSAEQLGQLLDKAGKRFALLVQRGNSRIFMPIRVE